MQKPLMLKHYIPYLISDYVQKFNIVRPLTYPEFLIEMMESGDIHIVIKDTHEVISAITLNQDRIRYRVNSITLSYWLGEAYANKSFMSEALKALIDEWFQSAEYDVISAGVFTGNESSHKLLKKLGFVQEGFLKHAACDYYDVIHDLSLYVKFRKPTSV